MKKRYYFLRISTVPASTLACSSRSVSMIGGSRKPVCSSPLPWVAGTNTTGFRVQIQLVSGTNATALRHSVKRDLLQCQKRPTTVSMQLLSGTGSQLKTQVVSGTSTAVREHPRPPPWVAGTNSTAEICPLSKFSALVHLLYEATTFQTKIIRFFFNLRIWAHSTRAPSARDVRSERSPRLSRAKGSCWNSGAGV